MEPLEQNFPISLYWINFLEVVSKPQNSWYLNGTDIPQTLESHFMPHYNDNHKILRKKIPWVVGMLLTTVTSPTSTPEVTWTMYQEAGFPPKGFSWCHPLNSTYANGLLAKFVLTIERGNPVTANLYSGRPGFTTLNFNWDATLNCNLVYRRNPFRFLFLAQKVNEQHTSFTQESVDWLLEELAGNPTTQRSITTKATSKDC